jgi:glycosyltransferase involved in cell wall biosynthesis
MHITLVDDSIPFDGYTAAARPLGGAEKAFAALPGALARRGHTVAVINRCRWSMLVEGAQWDNFSGRKPLTTDLLIAFRKPSLLEFMRQARRRVLWHVAPGRLLERPATRTLLQDHQALVLLVSQLQADEMAGSGLTTALLPPAVKSDFLAEAANPAPASPPHAIVTSHPAHGLDWLIDLWVARIHPLVPDAELHLHSMSLAKAAEGGAVDPALAPLVAKVTAGAAQGIRVIRPQGDHLMAQAYRSARVHLYPGHSDDSAAYTLMESHAAGVPAVVRPLGAAPERIANGRSGMVAPDDEAFANLAALLLRDDGVHASHSAEARALYQGRNWDTAAAAVEELLG